MMSSWPDSETQPPPIGPITPARPKLQQSGESPGRVAMGAGAQSHDGCDLGILFVHGMGDTNPGDTLDRFVDPMLEWIKRWATRDFTVGVPVDGASVADAVLPMESSGPGIRTDLPDIERIDDSVLRSVNQTESQFTPPHSVVRFSGAAEPVDWLITEAWWADEFAPPKFPEVAKWALGVAPYLLVRHFQPSPFGQRPFSQFVRYVWALLLVLLFELVITTLLAIGLIPFLKQYVAGLILNLIGSFGDVMVYLSSTERSSAIRSSVERSLHWLQARNCGQLVIIGYSLGSLISYDILNRDAIGATSFVTFGAPLKKTNIILQLQRERLRLSLGILSAIGGSVTLAVAAMLLLWEDDWGWSYILNWSFLREAILPYALIGIGLIACSARLTLWMVPIGSPLIRLLAPAGCLLALIGAAIVLVDGRWAPGTDSVPWWLNLAGVILLVIPLVLSAWREIERNRRERQFAIDPTSPNPLATGRWTSDRWIQGFLLAGALLACGQWGDGETFLVPVLYLCLILYWSAVKAPLGNAQPDGDLHLQVRGTPGDPPLTWLDFWASADPFPEYGLPLPSTTEGRPLARESRSVPVSNRRSLFRDHSIYGENWEEFIGPLAAFLLSHTGFDLLGAQSDRDRLEQAQAVRRSRVTFAQMALLLTLVPLVFVPIVLGKPLLQQLGEPFLFLRAALDNIFSLPGAASIDKLLLGLAVTTILLVLWYQVVVFQSWRQWDKSCEQDLFRRHQGVSSATRVRCDVFMLAGIIVPFALPIALLVMRLMNHSWWADTGR